MDVLDEVSLRAAMVAPRSLRDSSETGQQLSGVAKRGTTTDNYAVLALRGTMNLPMHM